MSAENGANEKLSDAITELCDALAEIQKASRRLEWLLGQLVDKRERDAARKMIGLEALNMMQMIHRS